MKSSRTGFCIHLVLVYSLVSSCKNHEVLGFSPRSAFVASHGIGRQRHDLRRSKATNAQQRKHHHQQQQQQQQQQPALGSFSWPRLRLATRSPSLSDYNSSNSNNNNNNNNNEDPMSAAMEVSWEAVVAPSKECDVDDEDCVACVPPLPPHPEITLLDLMVSGVSTAALFSLLTWLVILSGDWRYYISGGICAAVSHVIPVPVDVVKTRKQVDPALANHSFIKATKLIYKTEGLRGLFVGSGPTFVGYFLEGAIKFGVYEVLKPIVQTLFLPMATHSPTIAQYTAFCLSAAISGVAASVMLCPMEALRIRLVAEPEYANLGWMRGGMTIMKREGVSGFAKGILPMIYKQVPYTITKNVSFDFLTKLAYASLLVTSTTRQASSMAKIAIPLASAAIASVLSCITSQPGDMLLSLVNAHKGGRRTHDVARDILRSDKGIAGFFVGIKTRFLHVGIIVTLQLLIYDLVKRLCGIAATGSV